MRELLHMGVHALSLALARREISAVELTEAYLAQISRREPEIGAYLTVATELARTGARQADERRARGEAASPLHGIPGAYGDDLCLRDLPATCASRMLADYVPPHTAFAVRRLEEAGTIALGKLNMDEFGMGAGTESSAFHLTRNPLDPRRTPGGGAAAAVAAREAAFALASDAGGTIRQSAAFCGLVGMRPTYGLVSRGGLISFASSLDQIGPLTRDVPDNALILSQIAAHDPQDATSMPGARPRYEQGLDAGIRGLRVAMPRELLGAEIAADVRAAVHRAALRLQDLGARVEEIDMRSLTWALPAFCVLSGAEASSNLARFDGLRYGHRAKDYANADELFAKSRGEAFGLEVKRRILLGAFALSAGWREVYYERACKVRALIRAEYARVFERFDLVLSPTTPATAHALGEKQNDPLAVYAGDLCTAPASLAGLPALSLPCGRDQSNLPIGMQLTGRAFDEATLYRAGYAYECAQGGNGR